jgi:hypothetical protein
MRAVANWGRPVLALGLVLGLAACGGGQADGWGSTYQAVTYAGTMSGGLAGTLNFTAEDKYGNLSGSATVDGQPYCLIGTQDGDTVELTLSGPAGSGRLSAQVDGEAVRGPWTLVLDGQTRRGMATATEAAAVSDDGAGADCTAVQD